MDGLNRRHHDKEGVARQLDYIETHHSVISSLDHLDLLKSGERPKGCPAVITIDDGYHEFYDLIFPLIRSRGWAATFFATTGFVGQTVWFWWDKLAYVMEHAPAQEIERRVGEFELHFDLTTLPGRLAAWSSVSDILRWLSPQENSRVISELAELFGVALPETAPDEYSAITWDQAREMQDGGVLFGGHTVTHPILARMESEEALKDSRSKT